MDGLNFECGEGQLMEYGRRLGAELGSGAVVALVGDLGAGKTTLARGIAAGLGVTEPVTSPTFTLVCEYGTGRLPLYHFDVYRLGEAGGSARVAAELAEIGFEEYFFGEGVTIVEWADLAAGVIPQDALWIELKHTDDPDKREVCARGAMASQAGQKGTVHLSRETGSTQGDGSVVSNDTTEPSPCVARVAVPIGAALLAVETTGPVCSVCLRTAEGRVFYRAATEGLMHLTSLLPMVQELMREAGLSPSDLGAIAASAGPGSFTGIRIGVATVRALAQTLNIPVIKTPTLETFVYLPTQTTQGDGSVVSNDTTEPSPCVVACPIFDARREQMYAGAYLLEEDGRIMTLVPGGAYAPDEYFASLAAALAALQKLMTRMKGADAKVYCRMMGDGLPVFRARTEAFQEENRAFGFYASGEVQDARAVLAWALAHGRPAGYETLAPIYMRKAEAQRKLDERASPCAASLDTTEPSPCVLRPATEDDVYGISVIERLSFGEPWLEQSIRSDLLLEYSDYVVCEREGLVLAYAGLHRIIDEGHITNIAVHPSARGRGLGAAVLRELIRRAEAQGIADFTLEVRIGDVAAIRFYEKQGFVSEGARKDYYPKDGGGREDALIMWRRGAAHAGDEKA